MNTQITVNNDSFQITIPISKVYENEVIKDFIDYLRIKEISSRSKATDKDIEKLSKEINKSYWETHKKGLLS